MHHQLTDLQLEGCIFWSRCSLIPLYKGENWGWICSSSGSLWLGCLTQWLWGHSPACRGGPAAAGSPPNQPGSHQPAAHAPRPTLAFPASWQGQGPGAYGLCFKIPLPFSSGFSLWSVSDPVPCWAGKLLPQCPVSPAFLFNRSLLLVGGHHWRSNQGLLTPEPKLCVGSCWGSLVCAAVLGGRAGGVEGKDPGESRSQMLGNWRGQGAGWVGSCWCSEFEVDHLKNK